MKSQKEIDQFIHYCFVGKINEVIDALDNGMVPNVRSSSGETPIIAAINGKKPQVISCLITWMADLNLGNWTPLHELFDLAIDGMIQNNEFKVPQNF